MNTFQQSTKNEHRCGKFGKTSSATARASGTLALVLQAK